MTKSLRNRENIGSGHRSNNIIGKNRTKQDCRTFWRTYLQEGYTGRGSVRMFPMVEKIDFSNILAEIKCHTFWIGTKIGKLATGKKKSGFIPKGKGACMGVHQSVQTMYNRRQEGAFS